MWCHQFGSSVRLSPSSRMVTQRTLTDIDPFLWRLARSRFSRGLYTEGLLRTSATGWTTARGVSDGGADACVYGLVDALRLRQDTHTFCAFVDIRKAFDTSWIEATLVRLHQSGVTGGMWRTIANSLCGTLSQVRVRGDVSPPWVDTWIAQGRVLSPLLFNLLVNSLAAAIRRASPGVRLVPSSDFRLTALCR